MGSRSPTQPEIDHFQGYPVMIDRQPYRRALKASILPSQLIRVVASRSTPRSEILAFLEEHRRWIERVQQKNAKNRRRYPPKHYVQGEGFLFWGKTFGLDFVKGPRLDFFISESTQALVATIPEEEWNPTFWRHPQPQIEPHLRQFYRREAIHHLTARQHHFSKQMSLWPKKLSFRCQRTRWGSCSSSGRVTLNWRLIAAPPDVIDYVVVHELAHLRFPDHSRSFWHLVADHSTDYDWARDWLRRHHFALDFLSLDSELHSSPKLWAGPLTSHDPMGGRAS